MNKYIMYPPSTHGRHRCHQVTHRILSCTLPSLRHVLRSNTNPCVTVKRTCNVKYFALPTVNFPPDARCDPLSCPSRSCQVSSSRLDSRYSNTATRIHSISTKQEYFLTKEHGMRTCPSLTKQSSVSDLSRTDCTISTCSCYYLRHRFRRLLK